MAQSNSKCKPLSPQPAFTAVATMCRPIWWSKKLCGRWCLRDACTVHVCCFGETLGDWMVVPVGCGGALLPSGMGGAQGTMLALEGRAATPPPTALCLPGREFGK